MFLTGSSCVRESVGPVLFQALAETRMLSQMTPSFLCPEVSRNVYPSSNCGLTSSVRGSGFGELCACVSTAHSWKPEVPCPYIFLDSWVQRAPGGSLGVEVVVIPLASVVSDILETGFKVGALTESGRIMSLSASCFQKAPETGNSWVRDVSRSGGLPCALRIECTSESPTLSPGDLSTENFGPVSALGTARNQKDPVQVCT
eukprot:XP_017457735.1 PREDICTED: uncharacterized protein LOC102551428 [Rattus norvegicus]